MPLTHQLCRSAVSFHLYEVTPPHPRRLRNDVHSFVNPAPRQGVGVEWAIGMVVESVEQRQGRGGCVALGSVGHLEQAGVSSGALLLCEPLGVTVRVLLQAPKSHPFSEAASANGSSILLVSVGRED